MERKCDKRYRGSICLSKGKINGNEGLESNVNEKKLVTGIIDSILKSEN